MSEAGRTPQHFPHLGHGGLHGRHEVLLTQQTLNLILVDVVLQVVLYVFGHGCVVGSPVNVVESHVLEVCTFFDHGRHNQVEESAQRAAGQQQGQGDGRQTVADEAVLL